MARIALIQPPNLFHPDTPTVMQIPSIGLAYVGAALETAGHEVQGIDGYASYIDQLYPVEVAGSQYWIIGAKPQDIVAQLHEQTRIVGITCMFMHHWIVVRSIAAAVRARFPDIIILVGGEHVTGCPEYSLLDSQADAIVCGEGEMIAVAIADAIDKGEDWRAVPGTVCRMADGTVRQNARAARMELTQFGRPAWHLFPLDVYMDRKLYHGPSLGRSIPILATRGCPYQCTFCTSPNMWTTKWIAREPADVADEMETYMKAYGATDFQFVDLTAILKRQWILDFCHEIQKREWQGITWQLPSGTRSEVIDAEVARNLRASGVEVVTYAPESGSESMLKRIKKKVHIPALLASARASLAAGLRVESFMIIGYPDETFREYLGTVRLIAKLAWIGLDSVTITAYRPIPGTEISNSLVASGRLVFNDEVMVGLLTSSALRQAISFHNTWSDVTVKWLKIACYATFFGVSWLRRPWRALRILWNVAHSIQTTKLEKALIEMRDNRKRVRNYVAKA